jgi:hypothetical protein
MLPGHIQRPGSIDLRHLGEIQRGEFSLFEKKPVSENPDPHSGSAAFIRASPSAAGHPNTMGPAGLEPVSSDTPFSF